MSYVKSGLAFLGFLITGMGIGLFFHNMEAGGTVGFGLGILSIVLLRKDN
ncbi:MULTISPECIES: hypothetical protein [Ornithinibacillus]|uniref:Uncharacterized protein n=2 Tax=Ornithinibacillus TaxID=484508 RepID=A0A923L5H5_9BACI|nr:MULTISPECIES: hypothetical protein [Ornithinibacillus]MBC5636837.1 hypothetical protein [Ornithinibacillus hominis]MBS3681403.1 hypothetical protein [Ornithinibacillus massiliensis]